jgi:hypothetical protein
LKLGSCNDSANFFKLTDPLFQGYRVLKRNSCSIPWVHTRMKFDEGFYMKTLNYSINMIFQNKYILEKIFQVYGLNVHQSTFFKKEADPLSKKSDYDISGRHVWKITATILPQDTSGLRIPFYIKNKRSNSRKRYNRTFKVLKKGVIINFFILSVFKTV